MENMELPSSLCSDKKCTYLIGISGGSASGKTTVSERIKDSMGIPSVVLISMDSFYRNLTPHQKELAHNNDFNFDHPTAFDYEACYETLLDLKQGKAVEIPEYDFKLHSRKAETFAISNVTIIIFEGIFALYDKRIRDLMDMKIFVDTDDDVRLARRLKRDIAERGRNIHGVLTQYRRFVKPAFDEFIGPTMRFADGKISPRLFFFSKILEKFIKWYKQVLTIVKIAKRINLF